MGGDVVKVAAMAVICAIVTLTLKEKRADFAVAATITAGAAIILFALPWLDEALKTLNAAAGAASRYDAGLPRYTAILVKIVGLAYISEFGGQICADADNKTLAANVELAGKIAIIAVSAPIITDLLDGVLAL